MGGKERGIIELSMKEVICSSCVLSALARLSVYWTKRGFNESIKTLYGRSCFNEKPVYPPDRNILKCGRYCWRILNNLLSICRKI